MPVPAISTRSNLLDELHGLPPRQGLFHRYHPVLRELWLAHYTRNKLCVTALLKIRRRSCRYLFALRWHRQVRVEHAGPEDRYGDVFVEALVGCQGRELVDGVQSDFCRSLLLEAFIFQWP